MNEVVGVWLHGLGPKPPQTHASEFVAPWHRKFSPHIPSPVCVPATIRPNRSRAKPMSDLEAQIRAFQQVIRQALQEGAFLEQGDLAEVIDALRVALSEQNLSPSDGDR